MHLFLRSWPRRNLLRFKLTLDLPVVCRPCSKYPTVRSKKNKERTNYEKNNMLLLCCADLGITTVARRFQFSKAHGHNCCMVCPKVSFMWRIQFTALRKRHKKHTHSSPYFPNHLSWQSEICEKGSLRTYWLPCEALEPLEVLSGGITEVLGRPATIAPCYSTGWCRQPTSGTHWLDFTRDSQELIWLIWGMHHLPPKVPLWPWLGTVMQWCSCCIHLQKAKSIVELV